MPGTGNMARGSSLFGFLPAGQGLFTLAESGDTMMTAGTIVNCIPYHRRIPDKPGLMGRQTEDTG